MWGEGTGKGELLKDNICMDALGNLYILTTANQYNTNIIKVSVESKKAEVIYTTDYDVIQQLLYDGKYLYFFEIKLGEASWLTAIDTDGKTVNSRELEYEKEYLEFFALYTKTFPDAEVGKFTMFQEGAIYGVDDRYILIATSADVFKNLTSTDTSKVYSQNDDFFHEKTTVGVGLLNKEQFLNGESSEMIQIYQHHE